LLAGDSMRTEAGRVPANAANLEFSMIAVTLPAQSDSYNI
jgi:hypothetical protein